MRNCHRGLAGKQSFTDGGLGSLGFSLAHEADHVADGFLLLRVQLFVFAVEGYIHLVQYVGGFRFLGRLAGEDLLGGDVQILGNTDRPVIGQLAHFLGVEIAVGKTAVLFQLGDGDSSLLAELADEFYAVEHSDPSFLEKFLLGFLEAISEKSNIFMAKT